MILKTHGGISQEISYSVGTLADVMAEVDRRIVDGLYVSGLKPKVFWIRKYGTLQEVGSTPGINASLKKLV